MGENLEAQIRKLQEHYWSDADPQGRGFVPLAELYRRAGNLPEARRILKDGLNRHESIASGHVVLAWIHLDQEDPTQAEASFRAALAVDPENVRALKGLGDILSRRGEVEEPLEMYRALRSLDPLDPEVPERLAELETRVEAQAQLREVEALEEALVSQEEPHVWEDREEVAESLNWDAAAMQEDRSSVAGTPEPAPEGEGEGAPGAAADEGPEEPVYGGSVEEELESGVGGDVPGTEPETGALVTRTMGEVYLRQGLLSQAQSVFERLLDKDPGNGDLLALLQEVRDRIDGVQEVVAEEPEQVVAIADLAPDFIVSIADLAPDEARAPGGPAPEEAVPVVELAPDPVVSVESLAPDLVVPIESLAPDPIVPVESLAPDTAPEDPTLDDFEAWLDNLR